MNRIAAAALAAVLASTPVLAGETEDDDVAFDEAVRNFGYAGGAAWQCSPEDARRDIEEQAMTAFNGLARLFGTDRAFFFAAAFGAGTSDAIESDRCAGYVDSFTDGMSKGVRSE